MPVDQPTPSDEGGSSELSNNSAVSPPSVAWPGGVLNTLSSDLQMRGERCASLLPLDNYSFISEFNCLGQSQSV